LSTFGHQFIHVSNIPFKKGLPPFAEWLRCSRARGTGDVECEPAPTADRAARTPDRSAKPLHDDPCRLAPVVEDDDNSPILKLTPRFDCVMRGATGDPSHSEQRDQRCEFVRLLQCVVLIRRSRHISRRDAAGISARPD